MLHIKLQIACLIIALMPIIRNTRIANFLGIQRSKEIKLLQAAVLIEILLDAATAYTVNSQDIVPSWLNIGLHWLFYISIVTLVTVFFAYFMQTLQNRVWEKTKRRMVFGTYILSVLLITVSMPWIYFIKGCTTCYSYGLPVFVCFTMIAIILSMLIMELKQVWNEISGFQRGTALMILLSLLMVTAIQAIFPEFLISAIVPTLVIISASINLEDPQLIYQQHEREKAESELQRINKLLEERPTVAPHSAQPTPDANQESQPDATILNTAEQNDAKETLPNPLKLILEDQPYINTDGTFLYAEAEGNYINIVYFDGEKLKHQQVRQTMKQMALILADHERLMRVHRAYIVNLDMVKHVEGNSQGYQLTLPHTQQQVPVSRTYIAGFNEAFSA